MNRFNRSMLAITVAGGMAVGGLGIIRSAMADRPAAIRMDDKDKDHQYPHLHAALTNLKNAREELNQSDPIFGHHRDDAIAETDKAIKVVEDAWHATGGKDIALPPHAAKLDEPRLHGHMHKALSDLHDAYRELDDVESVFQRDNRKEAIDHVEKAIKACRDGLNEAEK